MDSDAAQAAKSMLLQSAVTTTTTLSPNTTTGPHDLPKVLMAQFPHVLAGSPAASVARSAKAVQTAGKPSVDVAKELAKLPPLNVETLSRVLRTLILWTSWVHEDVGHSFGSFIYNPVHTPGFVPADGKGIPTPALIYRVAMFRSFVAVERSRWPSACNPLEAEAESSRLLEHVRRCERQAKTLMS